MVISLLRNRKCQFVIRYFNDFLSRNPIHCSAYLTKGYIHWTEFLFWILSFLAFFIIGLLAGHKLVRDYKARNSAITNNIDYTKFDTSYPALTLCPHDILNNAKVNEWASTFPGQMEMQYKEFIQNLSRISTKWVPSSLPHNEMPSQHYLQLIFNLSNAYDITMDGKTAVKIMTEVGICYTINNVLIRELYTKHWSDLNPYPKSLNESFLSDNITFNFYNEFPWSKTISHNISCDITVYIHSPYEIPTTWTNPTFVIRNKSDQDIRLTANIKQISYDKIFLEEIWIKDRLCRNETESNLNLFSSLYSRNMCLMECRVKYIQEICNCIPHFYHHKLLKNANVCDVKGLKCFKQYLDIFRNINANSKSTIFKCDHCVPNCIDQIVLVKISNSKRINTHSRTILIEIKYPPLESYERSVLFTQLDYVVTLSSVLSSFCGFCVYSLMDCVFFFTVRIYWFRKGYRGSVDKD